ncbi:MAG: hypothetical protein AB1505_06310 [Candidatus Latescibacterota bacterium]
MKERPDLRSPQTPAGVEIHQLAAEPDVPACHVYMEAQVFTPDSRLVVLHRSAHAHGSDPADPEHRYLACDLESGGTLWPLTGEAGATAPAVSPDGTALYYFVDQTTVGGGRLLLRRVGLDGSGRETLLVLDGPVPGTRYRFSRPYPLSTISADGARLGLSGFLGDGRCAGAPWGLLVFELGTGTVQLILEGPSWCNVHPQFCRSMDPRERRDLLVQENHGNRCDAWGRCQQLTGGAGADIHVMRDDGTDRRDLPWGRDGNEFCQGHQCWVGHTTRAITSTGMRQPPGACLIAGRAAPAAGHRGRATPAGWRCDLTRQIQRPDFHHFATDAGGRRLITDSGPQGTGGGVWLARLPQDEAAPLCDLTFLLGPRSSWAKGAHIHPFLSPDGRRGFFNSDESGVLQPYMVQGWGD